jgi:hypothetical protein
MIVSLRIGSNEAAALANILYSFQTGIIDPNQIGSGWRCLDLINCHRNSVVRQCVATPYLKPSLHRISTTPISRE